MARNFGLTGILDENPNPRPGVCRHIGHAAHVSALSGTVTCSFNSLMLISLAARGKEARAARLSKCRTIADHCPPCWPPPPWRNVRSRPQELA